MNSEPSANNLFVPALSGFYAAASNLSYPMIRFIIGFNLIPHGAQKLFGWFGGGGMAGLLKGLVAWVSTRCGRM